jgi:hypothetical protein
MRFSTLNLLDGKSTGYFGFRFYLDYMVAWVTTQGSLLYKHTHRYMCLCLCAVQNIVFFMFLFRYIIQIKERFH